MALTAHSSCLLALLVAGLAQGIRGSLRAQDLSPQPLELKEAFKLFQIQFNRSYLSPEEHAHRLDIFAHNLAQAQRLQEEDLGTAEFGVTPFSDLTEEEFGQLSGYRRAAGRVPGMGREIGSKEPEESVPFTCDWRKVAGAISPIKDQKNCNCCWAMAAAGNIEALWRINFWDFVDVSVQELLDCGRCGDGCHGGFVWDAFITVLNNSGLASEKDYPFQGKVRAQGCHAKKYHKVAWIQDFIMLQNSEHRIAQYLATYGPITVTINMKPLQLYRKGVIKATPTTCDPQLVDHSVLLVGFGSVKSEGIWAETVSSQSQPQPPHPTPYWILKNSWGAQWGEKVSVIYWERGKAEQASSHLPTPVSPNLLGLLPAAPREQYLWHHQVPAHCPCAETGCEAPSLLPSLNPPGPLSSVLLGQLPPRQPYPQVFAHLPNRSTA
ncbi:PREDICTED: cathepsin W isoform X1 [Colobus angolensis palliatus]|uniref:cathepsin W isoform X1 n=1 Tax=Colobus angolensis palliatus TaxID=336983 RepID=UPI0005F4792D|nr:PREDICTED: cathepsin W isoform X1 [Colobus angolensis palliatus]